MSDYIEGKVILIDKALNWTSFDVVKKVRYMLLSKLRMKKLKVGHAGTLDPLATGLLILCTGKMTKQISQIQDEEKEYTGIIRLGSTTPSSDLETQIDHSYPFEHLTEEMIKDAAKKLIGEIEQVPPVFSAKKIDGKRAYDYAREGKEIIMKANTIHIKSFELEQISLPDVRFRIVCSKGTYIRSIARDLGDLLNCGGHLISLRRTRIGNFRVEDAMQIPDLEKSLQ